MLLFEQKEERKWVCSKESVISFVSFVPLTLSKFFFPSLGCTTGMTEVQPVIPLLLNTAINLARPIPSVQEYSSNPPPIPPPPEKYYASTEICKVSIQKKKKNVSRSRDPWRLVVARSGPLQRVELCQTFDSWLVDLTVWIVFLRRGNPRLAMEIPAFKFWIDLNWQFEGSSWDFMQWSLIAFNDRLLSLTILIHL